MEELVAEVVGIEDVGLLEAESLSCRVIYKHIIFNATFSVRNKNRFTFYTINTFTYPSTGLNEPESAGMRRNWEVGTASRL